ncbi:MAG: short chain dehydrogenase [Bacteroidota bacterium]
MKIILVGASGVIGKRVADELGKRHEIIAVSRNSEPTVDITSSDSIENMYQQLGAFDAMICCAGSAYFGSFEDMTEEDFYTGIRSKMMGQINLVMIGRKYINPGGSFTLTSGILADEAVKNATGLSVVNGALNSFVMAAATELTHGVRLNVICPSVVEDSRETYGPYFQGFEPVPMHLVTRGYERSVEGVITGRVIKIY